MHNHRAPFSMRLAFFAREDRRCRAGSIPTGLYNSAQGCEERATLGIRKQIIFNPERVASITKIPRPALRCSGPQPFQGCEILVAFSQGSSFLATLGFVAESLWDSAARVIRLMSTIFTPRSRPDKTGAPGK